MSERPFRVYKYSGVRWLESRHLDKQYWMFDSPAAAQDFARLYWGGRNG